MRNENPKVNAFVDRATIWQGEIRKLRSVLLACGLEEELKWGKPCYALEGRNIAIIQPFKSCCAVMFFKGVLLDDTHGLLRPQGPNSRTAMRLEFTSEKSITKTIVRDYVKQAMQLEREGRRVEHALNDSTELPIELSDRLRSDAKLRKAFESLTPGRRRGYAMHIGSAKQSKTRSSRTEKCIPAILAGKGFNER